MQEALQQLLNGPESGGSGAGSPDDILEEARQGLLRIGAAHAESFPWPRRRPPPPPAAAADEAPAEEADTAACDALVAAVSSCVGACLRALRRCPHDALRQRLGWHDEVRSPQPDSRSTLRRRGQQRAAEFNRELIW